MIRTVSPGPSHETLSVTDLPLQGDLSWLGPSFTFRVTGWSMFPTLRHGDVLEVVPAEAVTVGDLVLFRHGRTLVCHRVVALPSRETVQTRGDGVEGEGEVVPRRDLAGKVAGIRRGGRALDPARPQVGGGLALSATRLRMITGHAARYGAETLLGLVKGVLGSRLLGPLTASLLTRAVSFSLGLPAPVKLLAAYCFVPIGRRPLAWPRIRARLGSGAIQGAGLVLARLGSVPLGTLDPRTGSLEMRRAVAGLGVEEELRAVAAEWSALCAGGSGERAQREVGVRTQRSSSASSRS